jgi:hypothetical protein
VIHSPPRAPLHFQRKKGKQPAKFRSRAVEIEEVRSDSTVVKLHFTYLHSRITKTRKKKDPKNPGPMRSARVANIESFITIAIPSYATHITKNTKTSLLGSCNRVCFMRFVNIPRKSHGLCTLFSLRRRDSLILVPLPSPPRYTPHKRIPRPKKPSKPSVQKSRLVLKSR